MDTYSVRGIMYIPHLDEGERMAEKFVYRLSEAQIRAIEATLAKGDRAEVVPVKDGIKILRARREEVKT